MKAVCYDRYGAFDVLELKNVGRPVVGAAQVLVRVRATALHIGDVFSVKGEPFAMRLATGLFKPKHGTPGFDLAGHVEAVGEQVTRFKPGDAVFGASQGTCAEYVLASEDQLALKPARLGFEQAAVLATSGLAALHGLVALARMVEAGSLMPAVDRTYLPSEVPAALAYIETGHVRGKVAVSW